MRKIKSYKDYNSLNESLWGIFRRLIDPKRKNDDQKALDIFEMMKEDFLKSNKNLYKVRMSLDDSYTNLFYRFNEYDANRDVTTDSMNNPGDMKISITHIPTELLLKRSDLEQAFNVKRGLKIAHGTLKFEGLEENSNFRKISKIDESINITCDIAKQIITYFKTEYEKQYPQIKSSRYYNGSQISDIEKGNPILLKYVEEKNKNGKWVTRSVKVGDDIEKIKKEIRESDKEKYYSR